MEHTFKIEHGALIEVPIYNRDGDKNWAASVTPDQKKPGGLDRTFWNRARGGGVYYNVRGNVLPGTVVEFGADEMDCGRRICHRWYGVLVAREGGHLKFHHAETPKEAFEYAKEMKAFVEWMDDTPKVEAKSSALEQVRRMMATLPLDEKAIVFEELKAMLRRELVEA